MMLATLLVPSLLSAQRAGTVELGGFGYYTLLDDDILLGKNAWGAGGRLGFFALRYLSVEAEYSWANINDDNVRGVTSWTPFRGFVLGHLSLGSSTRFIAGIGYKQDRWAHDQTDNEFEDGFTALAGFRKCFNKWSIRPEFVFDQNPSPNFQTPVTETSRYFSFRFGVSRFFGRGSGSCGEPEPPVSATLSANPSTVSSNGGSTTLSWTSMNAKSCVALSPSSWTTKTATSGSETVQVASQTTYSIECRGSGGRDTASATVSLAAPPPPPPPPTPPAAPTVTLTGAGTIDEGGSATLSWTSTNATSCSTQSPNGWAGSTATSGSATVRPTQNTTYTIQCTGPGGNSNTASATVEVRIRPRTISILGAALFRFDSSNVDPARAESDPVVRAALDSLNALADRMNNAPTANVVFVGNTDYVGSDAYNDALSERRARSVYAYLRSRITDQSKLSNTIVWACGEKNANQTPPRPPEREKGRFVDRNVTVYVNQPDNVIRAPNCRQITP
jgi:outer membrane protein OmpA-like peptidoglycan-associated protein